MRVVNCASCGKPIIWRYTLSGAKMPLDPHEARVAMPGSYVVTDESSCRPAEPMFDAPRTMYHISHWETCPKAEQFRRS